MRGLDVTHSTATSISTNVLEAAIGSIDKQIAASTPKVELYFDRGQYLEMLGRKDEAVQAYVHMLRLEPNNVEALNALGLLTLAIGNRVGARGLLRGAVLYGPQHAAAHANLGYAHALDGELDHARRYYEHALVLDPQLAIAHHGLAQVLHRTGDDEGAELHRSLGLRYRPITIERFEGKGRPIYVLALGTQARGNIPTHGFFENGVFLLASITVDYVAVDCPLPPHDVIFNAIGEADLCQTQLAKSAAIVARTSAPIINHPSAVAATTRVGNSLRLREIRGVRTARTEMMSRASLTDNGALWVQERGFCFPLLLRSPGFHTGDHFMKIDEAAQFASAVTCLPGDTLLVIEYIDLVDAAGLYRKYRTIMVDEMLYPLHLATSRDWKVHYFSADMLDSASHRAADAAFLSDMRAMLGEAVMTSLEAVRATLGLDYGGIDFALDAAGYVVVFEANASMIVPQPAPGAIWEYRRAPVARIRNAVREMLVRRAAASVVNLAHLESSRQDGPHMTAANSAAGD